MQFFCHVLSFSCDLRVILEVPGESGVFVLICVMFCPSRCHFGVWCHVGVILESGFVSEMTKNDTRMASR